MIHVITDTHLGHEKIKEYCGRPDNFEKIIERRWKELVKASDTVIHLGDVEFKRERLKQLCRWPGKKILLRGNHDKRTDSSYLSEGFSIVAEELLLNMQGIRLLFSHRPRFGHEADINIHGHQHNLGVLDPTRLYLPLSLEHMGYAPMALDDAFIAKLKPFVTEKRQPTTGELMKLFQNAIGKAGPWDLYGNFDKEGQEEARARLQECYSVLGNPPCVDAMRRNRLWDFGRRYVEGRMEREDFLSAVRSFVFNRKPKAT